MGFLKLATPGNTTSIQFAGDTLNKVLDIFTGIDIAATDSTFKLDINTETKFRTGKFTLADSDLSHIFIFNSPNITEDKGWTFPSTWIDGDEVLGRTTVQEMEGKVIDTGSNVITGISNDNIASDAAIETSKLADASSFVTDSNTIELTGKTIDVKLNTILRHSRYGVYRPNDDTVGKGEGALSGVVGIGTKGTALQNTAGKYDIWNTRAVADDAAGILKLDGFTCWRISNPLIRFAFLYGGSPTNRRVFKGLGAKRLINTNSDTAPLNSNESGIFIGYGSGDTQWQVFHNDAGGTCVKVSTGINLPGIATNYIVEIKANDSTPNFVVTFYAVVSPGKRGSVIGVPVTINSRIPAQTTSLYLQDLAITVDGSIQANNIHYDEVFA